MNKEIKNSKLWLALIIVAVAVIVLFSAYRLYVMPVVAPIKGELIDQTPQDDAVTEGGQNPQTNTTTSDEEESQTANANIHVSAPISNQMVSDSLLEVTGEASGWYFEGSFGIVLKSQNGTVLVQIPATAQGDWMTTDFVPFEAQIDLSSISYTGPATLVLNKANPSGLPQNAASVTIPIVIQ